MLINLTTMDERHVKKLGGAVWLGTGMRAAYTTARNVDAPDRMACSCVGSLAPHAYVMRGYSAVSCCDWDSYLSARTALT
ncbi:hypothetical protein LZ30DRAFT_189489 [Colletotrichum cereale]|nr:hypothetical protein LZ30DRAFT_189489 [Colletotrichum cereale]